MPRSIGTTRFRIPPALSSILALGTLQSRAVGILNRIDPLVPLANYGALTWKLPKIQLNGHESVGTCSGMHNYNYIITVHSNIQV